MKRRFWSGMMVGVILVVLLSGCAGGLEATRVNLDDGWMWSLDNDGADSFKPLDASQLSSLELLLENKNGLIWLKHEFRLSPELESVSLSVYLGRITMADRAWLNGVYLGGEGSFADDSFSEWNKARLYPLPSSALDPDRVNTLLLQIRVDSEGAIVSNPFIGTREDARFAALTETFWNSTVNLLCAAIMIIIGGYHFLLFIKRPVERENLLFSIMNFLTAIYLTNFFLTELPGMPLPGMSFLWFQKIVANAIPFGMAYIVTSFIKEFLGRKEGRAVRIVRLACLVIPLVAVFVAPDYGTLRGMRGLTQLFIFPPLLYILYMAIHSLIHKNREAGALLWGLSPLALSVVLDIGLHQGLKLYNLPYITSLGWQMVIISFLFVLANRFAGARTAVEELNVNLEKKVNERTFELSEANAQMKRTNDDLEFERDIANKDMKMAAFVQQSFFARKPPVVHGWDIAFAFKPMSGVSGDLYDFYVEHDELHGVSLFDVSGHGIASGLVTMLAKTIIYRQFNEGRTTNLSTVMSTIDRKVIEEKGDIENYLTGMMLRISGDRIEYVNAGHPEMLLRKGSSGIVRPVMIQGKNNKGRMLGIEGLSEGYTTIGFSMADEDALLFFTDCLPDARNGAGEEFGVDRITKAFSASGTGLAADKLDSMMHTFASFIGEVPLNDDLTVIVLQRTNRKKTEVDEFILPE